MERLFNILWLPVSIPAGIITWAWMMIRGIHLDLESSLDFMVVEIIAYAVIITTYVWLTIYWLFF